MIKNKILEKVSKYGQANVMVNCSGGTDSAIMLFETCKVIVEDNIPANIVVFTLTADARDRYNSQCANKVINVIARQFDNYPIISHQVFYAPQQEKTYFDQWEPNVIRNFNINLKLNATNLTPPKGTVILDADGNSRDLYKESKIFNRRNITSRVVIDNIENVRPYYNIDKIGVITKYKNYNLMNTLLPVTRSCENPMQGYFGSSRSDIIEDTTKVCGKCWWCLEKKWAITQVGETV